MTTATTISGAKRRAAELVNDIPNRLAKAVAVTGSRRRLALTMLVCEISEVHTGLMQDWDNELSLRLTHTLDIASALRTAEVGR